MDWRGLAARLAAFYGFTLSISFDYLFAVSHFLLFFLVCCSARKIGTVHCRSLFVAVLTPVDRRSISPNLIVGEDETVHEVLRAPRRLLTHSQVDVIDRNLRAWCGNEYLSLYI